MLNFSVGQFSVYIVYILSVTVNLDVLWICEVISWLFNHISSFVCLLVLTLFVFSADDVCAEADHQQKDAGAAVGHG